MDELLGKVEKILFNPTSFDELDDTQRDLLTDLHYDLKEGTEPILVPDAVKDLIIRA